MYSLRIANFSSNYHNITKNTYGTTYIYIYYYYYYNIYIYSNIGNNGYI